MMRLIGVAVVAGLMVGAGLQAAQTADPDALASQARKLTIAGQLSESIALFGKALAIDPELFAAHLGLGLALDLEGRYEQAREHLTRAIALAAENERGLALGAMAASYAFEGRTADAGSYYEKQFDLQMAAGNRGAAAATANAIGRVFLEGGRPDDAERWYRTGYETARKLTGLPDDQVDLWEMRWLHAQSRIAARRGRPDEAARHAEALKRLIDKGGENAKQMPIYHYLIGYNAFHAGKLDQAVAALQQADQEDPFILGLLAQAYEKQGKADAAREMWKKVLASTSHSLQNAFFREKARAALKSPSVVVAPAGGRIPRGHPAVVATPPPLPRAPHRRRLRRAGPPRRPRA
ncbi:MAG TPA: tetratricopeptide repeat protein [Vicinamibacterales bacterium]